MGLFSSLFGSPSQSLSQDEHQITDRKIRELVSRYKVRSLDVHEEKIIEEVIAARRHGDGKISLRQIEEALRKLKNQYKISETDRKGVMKVFTDYFGNR